MALSIKSDEADALARDLARLTGESLTEAVTESLRERLARERRIRGRNLRDLVEEIRSELADAPALDDRSDDEILGYNEHGHFD